MTEEDVARLPSQQNGGFLLDWVGVASLFEGSHRV